MKYGKILGQMQVLIAAFALSACGSIVPFAQAPSTSERASDPAPTRVSSPRPITTAAPQGFSRRSADTTCYAQLDAAGANFSPLPDSYGGPGCSALGAVQLTSLSGDASRFGVSNIGAVQCQTASTFNAWARFGVDRAARQILGSPLERIETMGSYSCRNVAGSNRRSAHATANAIDVSGFVLKDGRRISLKADWKGGTPAEREFLRVVHRSACKRFGTVLGPEYNRAHEDHFHLEGTDTQFCR